ncbi:hypothetical protein ACWDBO_07245 [Streptomyces mirabilis]|uniref:hypothetical protein n=1 Tax=Streptomyces mirabilis TaxID=68239 RepID=UPI00332836AD
MSACPLATAYPADPTRPSVPPNVLNEVKLASAETGVSQKLPLAILWQGQQWYQNSNPSLSGPLTEFGRFFDWSLTLGAKPDKSLGITHMKLETARSVVDQHREGSSSKMADTSVT